MTFRLYDYLPILLMFIVAAGFAVGNVLLSQFVGQRKRTKTKLMPYECGKDPVGSARERFSVKFLRGRDAFHPLRYRGDLPGAVGRCVQNARRTERRDALVCLSGNDGFC